MYDIELYSDNNGNSELEEYLKSLRASNNKEDRVKLNKIRMYINLLAEYGLELKEPYIKKINKEIWELRPLRNRILFVSWVNNKFILLNYFIKKTQKTPKIEIEKAMRLYQDYKKRSEENE